MKLLLDECTPRRLKLDFADHEVSSVEDAGLKGLKNGDLLRAAAGRFEVLITVDRRLASQQNLDASKLAIIVMVARPCRYPELKQLVPLTLEVLKTIRPGDVMQVR